MEPLVYVMAILGCSDGSAGCTQARIEPVRYASLEACRSAMPTVLMRNSDLNFPEIGADCRATPDMVAGKGNKPKRTGPIAG